MTEQIKMARCKFTIATTHPDLQGYKLTESALNDIARGAAGRPIILNFDHSKHIGTCLTAEVKGTKIECTGLLPAAMVGAGLFIVPALTSYRHYPVDGIETIDYCTVVGLSVTQNPADETLQPANTVKKVKNH